MQFQYGNNNFDSEPGELLQDASIVRVEALGPNDTNDLIGRLSAQLSNHKDDIKQCQVIYESSEVIAFHLVRSGTVVGERKPFKYPRHFYLDQFLKENAELAESKREQQRDLHAEVQKLVLHKKSLTHFNVRVLPIAVSHPLIWTDPQDKDTLKDLRSSIYYYENVADAKGDHERVGIIQTTVNRLKSVLAQVEKEIEGSAHVFLLGESLTISQPQTSTLQRCMIKP